MRLVPLIGPAPKHEEFYVDAERVIMVAQASDTKTGTPMIGVSVIVLDGLGQPMPVQGTPSTVAGLLNRGGAPKPMALA